LAFAGIFHGWRGVHGFRNPRHGKLGSQRYGKASEVSGLAAKWAGSFAEIFKLLTMSFCLVLGGGPLGCERQMGD